MKRGESAEAGFSLVELMITAGLMGIVALGVSAINKMGFMGQKTIQSRDNARTMTDDAATLLTSTQACLHTFFTAPGAFAPAPATGASWTTNANSLYSYSSGSYSTRYTPTKTYNNNLVLSGISVGGSGVDAKTGLQQWTGPALGTAGTGTMLVLLDWLQKGTKGNQGTGPQHLYRYFLVNATVNAAGKITACQAVVANVSSNGTGTEGYLPIWATSTNLGNSLVYQNASGNIGIGTNNPASSVDISAASAVVTLRERVRNFSDASFESYLHGNDASGRETWWLGMSYSNPHFKQAVGLVTGQGMPLILGTDANPRVWISGSSGNVGVGTASPNYPFTVKGHISSFTSVPTRQAQIWYEDGTDSAVVNASSGTGATSLILRIENSNKLILSTDGTVFSAHGQFRSNMGGGSSAASYVCYNGYGYIDACTSLRAFKTNIRPLELGLATVLKMAPVSYDWKKDGTPDIGFIAEEAVAVDPVLGAKGTNGKLTGVRYEHFTAVLTKAIQELYAAWTGDSKKLHASIKTLEEENAAMRAWACTKDPRAGFCSR